MAIEITKAFSVAAPVDAVWNFLIDPEKVAACLPGASITEQIDEQTYAGAMAIKVGPVAASYKGKIRFEKLDAANHTVEISGRGQEIRGKGGADMRMVSKLVATDTGTDASVTSVVNVTGILAQFGRGMIDAVSDEMFESFTKRMREELEGAAAGGGKDVTESAGSESATAPVRDEALDAVSFGVKVGGRVVGRMIRRPAFWVTAAAVAITIYWLLSR